MPMSRHERSHGHPPVAIRRPHIDWPRPGSYNDAALAMVNLWARYSGVELPPVPGERMPGKLTHSQGSDALLNLAERIMRGEVRTHGEVARVIQNLGDLIGPLGSTETEVDLAGFRVRHAVLKMQGTFLDASEANPPSNRP